MTGEGGEVRRRTRGEERKGEGKNGLQQGGGMRRRKGKSKEQGWRKERR